MSEQPKDNNTQPDENIDEVLDSAIENAEARKELSEAELDEVAGGGTMFGGAIVGRLQI